MNEDTWLSLEGSSKITGMFGCCRPGEPIADLVFVFMFGKVLKEVRNMLMNTENGWMLAYDESSFVEADMRILKSCWQRCVSPLRSFARLLRGTGSRSTSVWQRRKPWWSSGWLAETK